MTETIISVMINDNPNQTTEVLVKSNRQGCLLSTDNPVYVNPFDLENKLRALFGVSSRFSYTPKHDGTVQVTIPQTKGSEMNFRNGQKTRSRKGKWTK